MFPFASYLGAINTLECRNSDFSKSMHFSEMFRSQLWWNGIYWGWQQPAR